jgi:hypothetical protein
MTVRAGFGLFTRPSLLIAPKIYFICLQADESNLSGQVARINVRVRLRPSAVNFFL